MYGTSHTSVPAPMNGIGGELVDGSGTINPAALNNSVAAVLPSPSLGDSAPAGPTSIATPAGLNPPRGIKRSRTPDQRANSRADGDHDDDEQGRRKRGRPPKTQRPNDSQSQQSPGSASVQTPRMQSQSLPQQTSVNVSPPQASPPEKATPTKTAVVKALPTVRDHTTDQLNEEGDEYIPKEFDEAGEKKVDAMGYPQGGREFKCRTFRVPLRGNKLFMLATECARVLGYRDSYLLFNKNRSLHKIIASQIEKDDLIQQDVLPYSYRSRQIAIVSAKSIFRQFGSRVIVNGRRVRDDYWESKARKQGFTEDDLAGEKRPGAGKARDAAAAEAANAANLLPTLTHGDVIYSNALETMPHGLPVGGPSSSSLASLPMIHMATTSDDPRLREYNSMPRARQEITGQPYQDRSQPSSAAEILNHASHTADFNKILSNQRSFRQKGLEEFYSRQREVPETADLSQPGQLDATVSASQPLQSPQMASTGLISSTQPQAILPNQAPMMAGQAAFQAPTGHQQGHIAQSPIQPMPAVRPNLMHQRSNPSMSGGTPQPTGPYGYPAQQQQMWGQPPPPPQQSPMSAGGPQGVGMPQYATQMHAPQQSPSPMGHAVQGQHHPSQSPRTQHRPSVGQMQQAYQMHHPQAPQQQAMASMGYPGGAASPYAVAAARGMYPSTQGPGGQQFMAGNPQQAGLAMGMNPGGAMPGWPSTPGGPMQPGHPQPGQGGTPLGGWSGY
ncbi:putative nuclear localization protein [Aspergillus fischeri NRRL 181]|uniref:Nuclear localization protein, putative n=1 Tax=Neosartorya fischeri (strain ATCC 1020 / DSM 3700 / CBS 544.65 / FGSC A1164 / JCM 1740 / NRRL 181 / WB 181) TaxID=331117 RepID=A1D320_NEOFI|nr:nuclear localization protein, putative [Aspergillus fischeri NRRL 181]EAW22813.1 nuclear localization protein, putative [Aspergillus fischeri NRRL 181]